MVLPEKKQRPNSKTLISFSSSRPSKPWTKKTSRRNPSRSASQQARS